MYQIFAPAKVNLYLHVGPPRADGRHPLDSLVMFADHRAADKLTYEPGPSELTLNINGASGDLQSTPDNLVLRAAKALEAHAGRSISGKLTLEKRLPIGAGIGGGSANAAATLHLLNQALDLEVGLDNLIELARPLGGDVPACVLGRPLLMRDDGAQVSEVTGVPELEAILVCPPIHCATGPVFNAFDKAGGCADFREIAPPQGETPSFLRQLKSGYRNDLQAPAIGLIAEIERLLNALSALEHAKYVAMSGSGATCFALFESARHADMAHQSLLKTRPRDWIARTKLGRAFFARVE